MAQTFSFPTKIFSFWTSIDYKRDKPLFSIQKHIILGLAFIFYHGSTYSQIDSLKAILKNGTDKVQLINTNISLAELYQRKGDTAAFHYTESAIKLAKETQSDTLLYSSLFSYAYACFYLGRNYRDAIKQLETCLDIATHSLKDNQKILEAKSLLSILLSFIEENDRSLKLSQESAELAIEIGDFYAAARSFNNLGQFYRFSTQWDLSKQYYLKALQICEDNDLKNFKAKVSGNIIAILYDSTEAYEYLREVIALSGNPGVSPYLLPEASKNFATIAYEWKDYPKSLKWYQESYKYAEAINYAQIYYASLSGIIKCHWKLGHKSQAVSRIPEVLEYYQQDPSPQNRMEAMDEFYSIYADFGDYETAFSMLSRVREIKDSIENSSFSEAIAEAEVKFQTSEKERKIAQQQLELAEGKNRRNQLLILGISLISLISLIYLFYLNRQQKRKQEAEFALAREKSASERLRELDQLKTDFFTNISHELRTPLTLILSPVEDVVKQVRSLPIREKLEVVQSNAGRLLDLVNEIMDLSKIEAGKMELVHSNVDLKQEISRIFYSYESLAQVRKISYELEFELENPFVEMDRDKFEKILNNLLSNAIKFCGVGGMVRLWVKQSGETYYFAVEDKGKGIHPDDQPHVFDRFFQSHKGHNSLQGGTGVGLALSREFAQLMGGEISLRSRLGEGSNFTLKLPLKAIEKPEPGSQQEKEEISLSKELVFAPIMIQGEKPKLLVVEDNPQMGKYLIQILSDSYNCALAPDGQEALKQLRMNKFDCILSDVMMPNMDGFEFRAKVNENEQWRHIPFVLLTARHLEADKLKGFKLGIDDYVTKPFSTLELKARLHNLIQNKLEREAFLVEEAGNPSDEKLSVDQQMLQKIENLILGGMTDPQFGVESLASEMNYSSKNLGRIIKKLTGLTSVKFILEVRLQKARDLLERRLVNSVTEAQLAVGIDSPAYFTTKFSQRFGKNPREFGKFV